MFLFVMYLSMSILESIIQLRNTRYLKVTGIELELDSMLAHEKWAHAQAVPTLGPHSTLAP